MTSVGTVCDLVRSKNAGPFWVTIALFFKGADEFARYARSAPLDAVSIPQLYDVASSQVQHYLVENVALLKISFPRRTPQGGVEERDLHSGQQFVRFWDIAIDGSES